MKVIKFFITIIVISFITVFILQNHTVLSTSIMFKFLTIKTLPVPIYYFFLLFLSIILLIVIFYKIKYKIKINKKNKQIKQLETEINNLRNLDISKIK